MTGPSQAPCSPSTQLRPSSIGCSASPPELDDASAPSPARADRRAALAPNGRPPQADERDLSLGARQFLQAYPVTVVGSVTRAQGMDAAAFDVLLVDYDLPDGKGDAVVRAVRARGLEVFVVGISSHDAGNEALGEAGADATCKKVDFAGIEALLLNRCGLRRPPGIE